MNADEQNLRDGSIVIAEMIGKLFNKNPHPASGTLGCIMGGAQALGMAVGAYLADLPKGKHDEFFNIVGNAVVDHAEDYISRVRPN